MTNKKSIVFATSNQNKILEINKLLTNDLNIEIKTLSDINVTEDIPETGKTIKENAIQKASYIYNKYGYNCFAEDTGLLVDALNGEPGIYSARYAGEDRNDNKNIDKILTNLNNTPNRHAHFKTVIALLLEGKTYTFEGKIEGEITTAPQGTSGFGYDPIFRPNGYNRTFAEIGLEEKNKISHRAKALDKLINFLESVK